MYNEIEWTENNIRAQLAVNNIFDK